MLVTSPEEVLISNAFYMAMNDLATAMTFKRFSNDFQAVRGVAGTSVHLSCTAVAGSPKPRWVPLWYFGLSFYGVLVFGILVLWYLGIFVLWYFGILPLWYFGFMVFWYYCTTISYVI